MTLFRLALPLLLLSCALSARTDEDIHVTAMPSFPPGLDYDGVRSGDAEVAIEVDQTGKLHDCLVIACTRRQFGEETIRAVKQWTFKPGLIQGQPWGWVRHINVHFETDGVRIVMDSPIKPTALLDLIGDDEQELHYRAYSPKELDGIPAFTHFVAPQGPHEGVVSVEFYVDETGAVRLPAIRNATDDDLDSAALTAVSQWHFAPPLRRGKPVLLKVSQDLKFVDKKKG